MEKENKKFRDAAKKTRSEEIQKLVMHVRKLDKRVKQNRERLELKRQQQLKRAAEQQKLDIRRNLENIGEYEISEEAQTEHRRDLEDIEKLLDVEFGTLEDDADKVSEGNSDGGNTSECIVCEKSFKSTMAFNNHQKSRKHRLMVETLRKHMKEDDQLLFAETNELEDDSLANPQEDQLPEASALSFEELKIADVEEKHIIQSSDITCGGAAKSAKSKRRNQTKSKGIECQVGVKGKDAGPTVPVPSTCQMCSETFESKSKLHNHLKETGHASVKSSVDYADKGAKKKEVTNAKNKKQLKSKEF
uniref:C2H2-type domain-containing protein n=1 Tax=Ditylenchus dipsaci TaxID=166011 RepID=A0A915DV26_9BILA